MGALTKQKFLLKNPVTGEWDAKEGHMHECRMAKVTGTTNATANTETAHAHGLTVTPLDDQIFFVAQDKAGSIYISKPTDETSFYTKSDITSVSFTAIILYEIP